MNFDNKKYMDDTGAKKMISLVQDAITTLDDCLQGKANKTNTVNNVQYRVGNSITQSINGTDTTIVYVTDTPTENSNALITAGGVKDALDNIQPSVSEITAQQVDTLWDSIIPPPTEFTSNVQASTNSVDDGDFGTATQET